MLIAEAVGVVILAFVRLSAIAIAVAGSIVEFFVDVDGKIYSFVMKVGEYFKTAYELVKTYFIDPMVAGFNALVKDIAAAFDWLLSPVKKVIDTIGGWIKALVEGAKSLWQALTGGGGTVTPTAGGMARGGVVGGQAGIDSNLAYLTRGEFVVNAAAVQRIGVPTLHAINAMQFPRASPWAVSTPGAMPSIIGAVPGTAPAPQSDHRGTAGCSKG